MTKRIYILLIFIVLIYPITLSAQAQYKKGYKDGYCKAHREVNNHYSPCPVVGVVPIANVGLDTYQDGFARGYNGYKSGGNTSTSQNIEPNKMLIQGAKDLGKSTQPLDVGKIVGDAFSQTQQSVKPRGPSSTEIMVPVNVDLKKYTHVAIVSTSSYRGGGARSTFNSYSNILQNSIFSVVNPADKDNKDFKKKFKKNRSFLKDVKNENWIYLYFDDSVKTIEGLLYKIRVMTLRDYKNNILFRGKYINNTSSEVVSLLMNY